MRISEALALGRTLLEPIAGNFREGDRGCALGMIAAAAPGDWEQIYNRLLKTHLSIPCGCQGMVMGSGCSATDAKYIRDLSNVIVHLFNYHVMTKGDWTMEQLIDWLRSVEPVDPEEPKELECRVPEHVVHS